LPSRACSRQRRRRERTINSKISKLTSEPPKKRLLSRSSMALIYVYFCHIRGIKFSSFLVMSTGVLLAHDVSDAPFDVRVRVGLHERVNGAHAAGLVAVASAVACDVLNNWQLRAITSSLLLPQRGREGKRLRLRGHISTNARGWKKPIEINELPTAHGKD